jgi:uncharacterized coiled-coil DUF342 family protein
MVTIDWKAKALESTRKNKQLKKRIKELTKSRDDWKKKSMCHKEHADNLAADLKKIMNKLNELIDIQ